MMALSPLRCQCTTLLLLLPDLQYTMLPAFPGILTRCCAGWFVLA